MSWRAGAVAGASGDEVIDASSASPSYNYLRHDHRPDRPARRMHITTHLTNRHRQTHPPPRNCQSPRPPPAARAAPTPAQSRAECPPALRTPHTTRTLTRPPPACALRQAPRRGRPRNAGATARGMRRAVARHVRARVLRLRRAARRCRPHPGAVPRGFGGANTWRGLGRAGAGAVRSACRRRRRRARLSAKHAHVRVVWRGAARAPSGSLTGAARAATATSPATLAGAGRGFRPPSPAQRARRLHGQNTCAGGCFVCCQRWPSAGCAVSHNCDAASVRGRCRRLLRSGVYSPPPPARSRLDNSVSPSTIPSLRRQFRRAVGRIRSRCRGASASSPPNGRRARTRDTACAITAPCRAGAPIGALCLDRLAVTPAASQAFGSLLAPATSRLFGGLQKREKLREAQRGPARPRAPTSPRALAPRPSSGRSPGRIHGRIRFPGRGPPPRAAPRATSRVSGA